MGAGERALARRLYTMLGKRPLSDLQDLRVARATRLLRNAGKSINLIAAQIV